MTIASRLRLQLDRNNRSISWLAREIDALGLRGGSYGSVRSYVNGAAKAAPPLEFLNAAAKLLGVRPAWLISGHGEATEELEKLRMAGALDPTFRFTWGGVPRASQSIFGDLLDALILASDEPVPMTQQLGLTDQIRELLKAPFGQWGFPADMAAVPPAVLAGYTTSVLNALRLVVAEPRSQTLSALEEAIQQHDEEADRVARN